MRYFQGVDQYADTGLDDGRSYRLWQSYAMLRPTVRRFDKFDFGRGRVATVSPQVLFMHIKLWGICYDQRMER